MTEFIQFTLDDGSVVFFESADSGLVSPRGGEPTVAKGGGLTDRLQEVAKAAEQVAGAMRSRLTPNELSLEFGLKVSAQMNWWFFAKAQGEGAIKVTVTWSASREAGHANPQASGPE